MSSFVTVEAHEEVEHKRHSSKLSTEQISVSIQAGINLFPNIESASNPQACKNSEDAGKLCRKEVCA